MKRLFMVTGITLIISLLGCEALKERVRETPAGYQIQKGINLSVVLQTPLSSNTNQRGDGFTSQLKQALVFKEKTILPKDTQIRGLVKRVTKYEKFGDRASLLLLFDQVVLPDGRRVPLAASLDTQKGSAAIKIKGKAIRDAKIVGGSAIVGALMGRKTLGKDGTQKGFIIGAAAGTGAVILSDMKEVKLPQGTEIMIKLDEVLLIPHK
jgi:hypothetical protein